MGDETKLLEGMGCGKQEQSLEESEIVLLLLLLLLLHYTERSAI